jgi:serine/threonine-protein phosphatase PGAM5
MKRWILAIALLATVPAYAPAADAPPRPRGVHYIYLIRHGTYDRDTVNTDDRIGGALNALGHEQARLVGTRLASLPVKFRALVTSDFTRARETADEIGTILHMSPVLDSLIHECTPAADNPDYMKNHSAGEIALCESNLAAAWAKYMVPTPDADTNDLLVCHGNFIRWMVTHAVGGDTTRWPHMEIANGSLTILAVRPDGQTRLVIFSDASHIPLEKQTWTGRGAGWDAKPVGGMR